MNKIDKISEERRSIGKFSKGKVLFGKMFFCFIFLWVMFFLCSLSVFGMEHICHYGWGFKKNHDHTTPDIGSYEKELEGTSSYYVGDINQKELFLTFDAGYDNGNLSSILDTLQEKNVKAAFFVTGDFLTRNSDLVLRMKEEGHIVGNHSWGHKNITKINEEELKNEIQKVEEKYQEITHEEMKHYFRPPEGEFNHTSLLSLQKLGYKTIFWSLAYQDWDTNRQHGSLYAYQNVMNHIHNGAIILLHTVSKDNKEALGKIIDDLQSDGYVFKTLDDL